MSYFKSTIILKLLTQVYYLSNGIIPSQKYKNYEPFLQGAILVNSGFVIFGMIKGLCQARKLLHKMQLVSILLTEIGVTFFKIFSMSNKKNLQLTTSKLCESSKFGIENMADKVHEKMKAKFFPLIAGVLVSFVILFNITFISFLMQSEKDYNDMDYYVIPELFVFSRVNSFAEYLGVLAMQIVFLSPEVIAYVSLTTYMCYVVSSLEVHIEEIRYLVADFICFVKLQDEYNARRSSLNQEEDLTRLAAERKFQTLIEFQQYTFEYLNNFINFGKWIFNAMFTWFFCTLVSFIFLSDQVDNNAIVTVKVINAVAGFVIVFYILCYSGEVVSRMNESMAGQFYDTSWYTLKPSFRKWFLTLVTITQDHIQLKAFNMFTIDLRLFVGMLKTVYSIVNVMKMKQNG